MRKRRKRKKQDTGSMVETDVDIDFREKLD
jgi:hypothetical protein